jgi:hypothetical protein
MQPLLESARADETKKDQDSAIRGSHQRRPHLVVRCSTSANAITLFQNSIARENRDSLPG